MEFNALLPYNNLNKIEIRSDFSFGMFPFSSYFNMYFYARITFHKYNEFMNPELVSIIHANSPCINTMNMMISQKSLYSSVHEHDIVLVSRNIPVYRSVSYNKTFYNKVRKKT